MTTVGLNPLLPRSDGLNMWVPNATSGTVSRVRGSDGRLLETWTGALAVQGSLIAMGKVLLTGSVFNNPGRLFQIDPGQPAGAVTTVASNLGSGAYGLTFDGLRVWTANNAGSISIVTPTASIPWTVTTVSTGFAFPTGALFDGTNVWISDQGDGKLLKVDSSGAILQTVTVSFNPQFPVFDGTNIWAPIGSINTVRVIRASSGAILASLTGNGLDNPGQPGIRRAEDPGAELHRQQRLALEGGGLHSAGDFPGRTVGPYGACSDGVYFWITLNGTGKLLRF